MIRKPYSGNLNVRLDEGELEIELLATTPALYSTVLAKFYVSTHSKNSEEEIPFSTSCSHQIRMDLTYAMFQTEILNLGLSLTKSS